MKKRSTARKTFATVLVGALALGAFGTSTAVAGGMITSKQIKNNTIKSKDIKDNTLKSKDVKDGTLAHADLTSGKLGVARGYLYSGTTAPALDVPVDLTGSKYAYNSAGGTVSRTRTATGVYSVTFGGVDLNAGNVQVTAYGPEPTWCKVSAWAGSSAIVRCFDDTGAATNSRFTLAFLR